MNSLKHKGVWSILYTSMFVCGLIRCEFFITLIITDESKKFKSFRAKFYEL